MVALCSLKAASTLCDPGHFPIPPLGDKGETSKGEIKNPTPSVGYPMGQEGSGPDRCLYDPSGYLEKLEQQQCGRDTGDNSQVAVVCRQEAGGEGT